MGAILHAHPVNGQAHAMLRQPRSCSNIPWRLHLAWPPHPGHSTILLRLESPSSMHTKLHIVAASKNRDHTP